MRIKLNECEIDVTDGATLFALRDDEDPKADVTVRNGAPANVDVELCEGDCVVFIQRGRVPGRAELEALMVARHSPGVHEAVRKATVGIAGAGGLGSAIAIALARVGVGRLVIADFDVIEPSNLNRQQYFVDQIGMLKVEALKENLARVNPYVDVRTHALRLEPDNIPVFFGEVDVMAEAFDVPDGKAMLAEAMAKSCPDIPLVMAIGMAGFESSNSIRTRRVGPKTTIVGDLINAAGPGTGLMAPRVGVAAHHQANAILRLLLGENSE